MARLDRLGRTVARRRHWVEAGWLALLLAVGVLAAWRGGTFVDDYTVPGTQSQDAANLLNDRFASAGGSAGQIVFHRSDGPVSAEQSAIAASVTKLDALPHVKNATNPFTSGPVSKDGSTAYSTISFDELPQKLGADYVDDLDTAVAPARDAGLEVEYGGAAGTIGKTDNDRRSEVIGLLAALVILLISLRAVVAAGLPLVSATVSVATGIAGLSLLASTFTLPTVAPALSTMIGLGVGIDYALFILTRQREELMKGATVATALGRSLATAGHAVLVAGCTVIVAILGLYLSGVPLVGTLGAAAAFVVAVSVAAALTLLPALVASAGRRVLPRADRAGSTVPVQRSGTEQHPHGWERWAAGISRRPLTYTLLATALLLVLAMPVLSMRLGTPDAGSDPTSDTDRRAYDLVTGHFGAGSNGPLTVVVALDKPDAATLSSDAQKAAAAVGQAAGVASVGPPRANAPGDVAVFTVTPTSSPQSTSTSELVDRLRSSTLPTALKGDTGATAYVTGQTAGYIDFSDRMSQRLPWLISGVLALAFLLLLAVFRSLVIAVKAVLLNLLSVGAAYGVVVAVFQWGWGGSLVGVSEKIPVVSYVPMMMFAIVFGLSMDYEVFLLSRIREAFVATGDNLHSVANGLAHTAKVISSAAAIMVCVFASFVLRSDPAIKMLGLGLAFAVLIDATVVRLVLVPSTMTLLGNNNWWIPGWLDRVLPRIDVESAEEPEQESVEPPGATERTSR